MFARTVLWYATVASLIATILIQNQQEIELQLI